MKKTGLMLASVMLLANACDKERTEHYTDRDCIAFTVGESVLSTKVGVTNENLGDKATIITKGTETNKEITYNNSSNLKLMFDSETGYWFPSKNNVPDRAWKNWAETGYSFTTYAYSPKNSTNVSVSSSPTTVTITEPSSYTFGQEDGQFVDYLLSYRHDITNGMTKPIVTMKLEHALSNVEIYVVKDPSIQGVRVRSMSLSGFYIKATMTCSQAQYVPNGTQTPNHWTAALEGSATNSYTWNDSNSKNALDELENTQAYLKFIAIPQNVSNLVLDVNLDVNEQDENGNDNWVSHPYNNIRFNQPGLPSDWVSGNKYIYILTIDTGIHLKGYIREWREGGSIETTILPEVPTNE